MNLEQIKLFFEEISYTNKIVIRDCETIENPSKTAKSLIYILENRGVQGCYNSYYKTLKLIQEKIVYLSNN